MGERGGVFNGDSVGVASNVGLLGGGDIVFRLGSYRCCQQCRRSHLSTLYLLNG